MSSPKKAKALPPGIAFPLDAKGRVSTTDTAKALWTAAIAGTGDGADGLCERIAREKDWRHRYHEHLIQVCLCVRLPVRPCHCTAICPGDFG